MDQAQMESDGMEMMATDTNEQQDEEVFPEGLSPNPSEMSKSRTVGSISSVFRETPTNSLNVFPQQQTPDSQMSTSRKLLSFNSSLGSSIGRTPFHSKKRLAVGFIIKLK